jgi:hypothetical protein
MQEKVKTGIRKWGVIAIAIAFLAGVALAVYYYSEKPLGSGYLHQGRQSFL